MEKHLIYHGPVNQRGVSNTEILLLEAMKNGATSIVLHICSNGGDVTAGLGLYNFIRSLPVRVDTHAFGLCGSIAATIFLAGETRTSVRANAFSLHAASFSNGPLAGQISPNTDLIAQPFKERSEWDEALIQHYFADVTDKRILPDEAQALRIVHSVQEIHLPPNADQVKIVSIPADE
ncbi:ATP-dependent Clp protease proteolytic subunit [Brevundimonas sp.]|uniref:ATP-dependent Clp protease proteolytic subunit n=1 Tax=Brevundimonas sp. TaxID=1871086 RepID=UPI0028A1AB54|nr:ATP-dependent Clp protease proteolytic subunit [Brevundimonas sp.]